jgi:hypothetical protein
LKDDDFVKVHDFQRSDVLRGLRLWAGLVPCHEEKRSVHHCSAVQHRRHQNVVAWAVNEADVPD